MSCSGFRGEAHHHLADTPHEVGLHVLGFADDLDVLEAGEQLFPEDPQLHFGQSVAHAPVYAEPEGDVVADVGPVDDEVIGQLEHTLVAVA